jgi:hypothetical protein
VSGQAVVPLRPAEAQSSLVPVDAGGEASAELVAARRIQQLVAAVRDTRQLLTCVGTAQEAATLVRRAKATEGFLDNALKSCRDLAEQQFELRQEAAETHLVTQRRAGQLLREMAKHQGGRPRAEGLTGPSSVPQTLREMGIESHESHRWQRLASIPEDDFVEFLRESTAHRKEITTAGALALAKRCEREQADEHEAKIVAQRNSDYAAFERSVRFVNELVWLDPTRLVEQTPAQQRSKLLEDLRRWMSWMVEVRARLSRDAPSAGASATRTSSTG